MPQLGPRRAPRSYDDYLRRARLQHGTKFSEAGLAKQFIPFFINQERIKIETSSGTVLTGTIGVTTGWGPCFLLMRTSRAIGSPWTLSDSDKIIAIQRGRKYVPVSPAITDTQKILLERAQR